MAEHVVSLLPVNVWPDPEGPAVVGYRAVCSCGRFRGRAYADRRVAETQAEAHLRYAADVRTLTDDTAPAGRRAAPGREGE